MKRLVGLMLLLMLTFAVTAAFAADGVTLDRKAVTLFEGQTVQLTATMTGNAEGGEVSWIVGSPSIASVNEDGLLTAVSKGGTSVTVVVKNNNRTWKASARVTVERAVSSMTVREDKLSVVPNTDASVDGLLTLESDLPVLVLPVGNSASIYATLEPTTANNRKYTLQSSNTAVLTASGTTIRAVSRGEAILTIASVSNPEVVKQYHVLTVQKVQKVTASIDRKSIKVGGTAQATAVISPDNATMTAVEWTSLSPKNATVDQNGVVTAIARGTARIRATAKDGSNRYGDVSINIEQQPESITLNNTDLTIATGTYATLSAKVLPTNANDKKVNWISSDESVAKVNQSGRITPVSVGTCTISCVSQAEPSVAAQCTVRVIQRVTKVSFTQPQATVNVLDTVKVFWTTEPSNATDPSVTLSSTKPNVATVDQDGTVHGIRRGECYIVATSNDGSRRQGRIKINVLQPVYGVHMRSDSVRVGVDEYTTVTAILEPEDASNKNMSWYSDDVTLVTTKGTTNKVRLSGHRWGSTTVHGVTEDGGYTTSVTVNVGSYDKALRITDYYLQDNKIKISVKNLSNMTITHFTFMITCYDNQDNPLSVTTVGSAAFHGSYNYLLGEMESTTHGRFRFENYAQPMVPIGRTTIQLISYTTSDGMVYRYRTGREPTAEAKSATWTGPTPVPTEVPAPENP